MTSVDPYEPPASHATDDLECYRFRAVFRVATHPAYSGHMSVWTDRCELWSFISGLTIRIRMEDIVGTKMVRHRFQWALEIAVRLEDGAVTLMRVVDFSRFLSPMRKASLEELKGFLDERAHLDPAAVPAWPRWPWPSRRSYQKSNIKNRHS